METFNHFFDIIASQIGSAFMTIIFQAALFAVIGLVVGILLINFGRKHKLFNRSFGLWTFVAKLNYVYIPVLLMVFGGMVGVLNGVDSAVEKTIDAASEELVAYSQVYITDFQEYIMETPVATGETLQDVVDAHLETRANLGWISGIAASAINMMIVRQCVTKMGVPSGEIDTIDLATALNGKNLSAAILSIPAIALKTQCSIIFWGLFTALFAVFTPFFLLPVYEFAIHFIVSLLFGKNSKVQPEMAY